jgi:5-methylcytosine-specific restriction endonuclease McrA
MPPEVRRPCIEADCPNFARGGRRGARCDPCQATYDARRNALPTRHPYLDPTYRAYPIKGKRCALQYPDICATWAATRDHIIPIAKGGTNEWSNLQPACRPCNSAKRSRIADTPPL